MQKKQLISREALLELINLELSGMDQADGKTRGTMRDWNLVNTDGTWHTEPSPSLEAKPRIDKLKKLYRLPSAGPEA